MKRLGWLNSKAYDHATILDRITTIRKNMSGLCKKYAR